MITHHNPEDAIGDGRHGGRARTVVEQCNLAKASVAIVHGAIDLLALVILAHRHECASEVMKNVINYVFEDRSIE